MDVKIGHGAVIGAGAIVAKDIPPYAVVVGNPAKVVKYRFTDEQIEKLLQIRWWNWEVDKIESNRQHFGDINSFIERFHAESKDDDAAIVNVTPKGISILIFADDSEVAPVMDKVLFEYLKKYQAGDDISLVVAFDGREALEEKVRKYQTELTADPGTPHIVFVIADKSQEKSLFRQVDYFVVTRSKDALRHIEYAEEYGVSILAGVNIPVFDEVPK